MNRRSREWKISGDEEKGDSEGTGAAIFPEYREGTSGSDQIYQRPP